MNFEIMPSLGRPQNQRSGLTDTPDIRPSASLAAGLQSLPLSPGAVWKVVVAYEHAAAGLMALRWLNDLLRSAGPDLELQLVAEPLAYWSDPESQDRAAADTAEADLLVLSTGGMDPVDAAGETSLASCLALPPGRTTTRVALSGTEGSWPVTIEAASTIPNVHRAEYARGFLAPTSLTGRCFAA